VQNNYNSLAAIIAGINGTSVHRLVQTRELVPQTIQKEIMKLEILMGTRKGYFAYRLAWDNTFGEKIPFLPLHLRDLVATEEGNPTFLGKQKDRINWKKFAIMGETVVSIQHSQGTPYPAIPRNVEMQRLILDGRISMDDEVSVRPSS
jgi:RasGEF domain